MPSSSLLTYSLVFLCQEDPLEKEMATHTSIPAWEIPQTEEPDGLQSVGLQRVMENPRDGGAWWAAVYGVAQSRTRLK